MFFYLSHNRKCYEKLAEEIRTTFTSSSEIRSGSQLSNCSYLRACIDETLRIAPPVPGTLWRELASNEKHTPLIIDGYVVPPDTQVGVNIYALHHNEKYFPDPYRFNPARWLPSETPESHRQLMHEAFTPFSVGYRGCAGKSMAYLEMSLVIAKSLWYFDFQLAPGRLGKVGGGTPGRTDGRGRPGEYQLYDVIAGEHDGPYLVFSPRANVCNDIEVDGLTLE
jgi:cytochrome P450